MKLEFTADTQAFRDEVRNFIADNCPPELSRKPADLDEAQVQARAWHRILAAKGWAVPAWPVEYGGTGWTVSQRFIWQEENARAGTPAPMPFGINMIGPILYTYGTDAQKKRFLTGIQTGDVQWCQGYSEPGAGSDLASLKTRAVREGDHYILNGQKTWSSLAHYADWGFFLVRSDPHAARPQQGITMILVDMRTPGITVRPIQMIDDQAHVCDIFLDNVKVPVENRIGEENKGWDYGKVLLAHERSGIAGVARSKVRIAQLHERAQTQPADDGGMLADDADYRRATSALEIDLLALEYAELRVLSAEQAGRAPGPESSLLKVAGTEIQQRAAELAVESAGAGVLSGAAASANDTILQGREAATEYFFGRASSIYGGSNEIQRNIIAKTVLGL